jgi:hypothetical protein
MKKRSCLLVLAAAMMVAPTLRADEPEDAPDTSNLPVPQRLLSEEQRQMQVSGRLDMVRDRASDIAEDLESNNLFKQTQGDRLVTISKVTGELNKTNLPQAAEQLRQARENQKQQGPHLAQADVQITTIVKKLQQLLGQTRNANDMDSLLAELRIIIKKETQLRQITTDWGKQFLQNPDALEPVRKEIARTQGELGQRTAEWADKLKKNAQTETDTTYKDKLTRADQVMTDKKGTDLVKSAAGEVENKKPIEATAQQDKALDVLKEVAKILSDDQKQDSTVTQEQIEALQKLLDQQKQLDQQVANADLQQQAQQLAVDQAQLQAALEQLLANLDLQALQAALEAMQAQQAALEQGQAPPEQGQAAADLQQALAGLPQPGNEPPQPGPPEQGPPQIGIGLVPHPTLHPPGPTLNSVEGPRLFANSTQVGGEKQDRSTSRWNALPRTQRDALYENYIGDLPTEYRSLLQDYYKALAE